MSQSIRFPQHHQPEEGNNENNILVDDFKIFELYCIVLSGCTRLAFAVCD